MRAGTLKEKQVLQIRAKKKKRETLTEEEEQGLSAWRPKM